MASIDFAHQGVSWESRTGFYPVCYSMVRTRASVLAYAAGRALSDVVQADYEQAIYELSAELEIETGLL